MHGICFEYPLQEWFDFKIPRTTIAPNYIQQCLESELPMSPKPTAQPLWLGSEPETEHFTKSKRGETWNTIRWTAQTKTDTITVDFPAEEGMWLLNKLPQLRIDATKRLTLAELRMDFESTHHDFDLFLISKSFLTLHKSGLLIF